MLIVINNTDTHGSMRSQRGQQFMYDMNYRPKMATHSYTWLHIPTHMATLSHTQPHITTHRHPQLHTATHIHTACTHSYTQLHIATHGYTQPHITTHSHPQLHTEPHTATHSHTQLHIATNCFLNVLLLAVMEAASLRPYILFESLDSHAYVRRL